MDVKLTSLNCTRCKKPLTNYDGKSSMVSCAHCGEIIMVTGARTTKVDAPERIVPFMKTEEEFEQLSVDTFIAGDYVPRDIFERVSFDDVRPIYLPMFLYEGNFTVDWECEVGKEEKDYNGKESTVWYDQNGTIKDTFSFCSLAYEGSELPEELADFAKTFPYEAAMSQPFESKYLTDQEKLLVLGHNQDKETVWHKYAKAAVNTMGEERVRSQLSLKKYRKLRCNVHRENKIPGSRLAFLPFWFVYFNYMGNKYHILMDGLGYNFNYTLPEDPVTKAEVSQWKRLNVIVLISAIALIVILIFVKPLSTSAWWSMLGILGVGYFIFSLITGSKKKKAIEHARELRRRGYKAISGS